jgi:regulator of protease activity HflC (stomatin/prohibitin superfamily)
MATIRNFGFAALLRSEASSYVIRYRNGRAVRSGRGLAFWFRPQRASIAELPMDDRDTALFVKGRSKDFQDVAVQGRISWRVADPQRLAERVDFTIGLFAGKHNGDPIDQIESRFGGLAHQAAAQYLMERPVRELLDAGLEPLRQRIEAALIDSPALSEIGVETITVRLSSIAPSSELERALQTPTFEALQQKADEAMFERRALAVDKERAIAENELANKVELARREKQLIAEEADNQRARAVAAAEAGQVAAAAEAERIRSVEAARAEAEHGHMAVYKDVPGDVLLALAARDFAAKLETINELNVTPDLIASLVGEFRKAPPAVLADAR